MFRFMIPDLKDVAKVSERRESLRAQMRGFMDSDPLQELCSLLEMDLSELCSAFDGRNQTGGQVKELQEIRPVEKLESLRHALFPLFRELGFIDINKPRANPGHIVVLGGSFNACHKRTLGGKRFLTPSVNSFDGITCYRPINPIEKKNSDFVSNCETEFGAMYDSFVSVLCDSAPSFEDDFHGDRNLHRIWCVRRIDLPQYRQQCRIYAAPSSQPQLRRADTTDSIQFYIDTASIEPKASILAVTNNLHCNRQFLQIAFYLLDQGLHYDLDIVGCSSDDELTTAETYDPGKYMQELIGILKLIDRYL